MYHTNSRIYQSSLSLVDDARQVMDGLPPGFGFLKDQLRRAVSGIPLTFIEGCGRRSVRDRRRFFGMARGSAYEVYAILDVAERLRVVDPQLAARARVRTDQLAGMLSRYR